MDEYQELVGQAVAAVREGNEARIVSAFESFGTVSAEDLVAELCNWVEDETAGQDAAQLVARATFPLPDAPEVLIGAVARNDLRALFDYSGGDLGRLLAAMVLLVASLQDARERA